MNLDALRLKNLQWSVRAGVNTLHNELTSLGRMRRSRSAAPAARSSASSWVSSSRRRSSRSTSPTKKVIVNDTLTPMGNLLPTLEWNLTNTVTLFKNFRVSALIDAKQDFIVQNNTAFFRETQLVRSNLRLDTTALSPYECLRHYGDLTPGKPAFVTVRGKSATVSDVIDAYLEPGDFVRFRELSATYTMPSVCL